MAWHEWLTVYVVVGAVAIAVLYQFRASKKPTFVNQIAASIDRQLDQDKPFTHRILERLILPGLALLFAWAVWPAMLVGRIWVFYQHNRK